MKDIVVTEGFETGYETEYLSGSSVSSGFESSGAEDSFTVYLKEIGSIPLLSPEEEYAVAKRAAGGSQQDLERLTEANLRLVIPIAKSFRNRGLDMKDLVQAGNLGLMKAARKFDPALGNRFSTCAVWWIRQSISRAIEDQSRTIRLPVHIQERDARFSRITAAYRERYDRDPTTEELAQETSLSVKTVRNTLSVRCDTVPLEMPLDRDDPSAGTFGQLLSSDADDLCEQVFASERRKKLCEAMQELPERERRVLSLRFGVFGCPEMTLLEIGRELGLTGERVRQIERRALLHLRASAALDCLRETA